MADGADSITLNGTTLLIQGIQAGKPVSEFTSGLRVGRASQDDRQHAFFTVLDDFSAGFGYHELDIREQLGTHWDNPGGVDLRRARHITLPPKRLLYEADAQPTAMLLSNEILDGAAIGVPADDPDDNSYYYYGAGDSIYRMAAARATLTRVKDMSGTSPAPGKCTRMFLFRGSDGTRRLYVITTNATINSVFQYSADPGAASPTFTAGDKHLWDAIVFENLVVAQDTVFQIIFNVNPTNLLDWNIDDVNDLQPLWRCHSICRFLGTAIAPWSNAPALYFIDYGDGRLYALDVYIRRAIPVEIGDFHYLVNGVVWNGRVVVTNGWNIWMYEPGGGGTETVRDISLFRHDGIPETVRDGSYRITGLIDGGPLLFAIAEHAQGGKPTTSTLGFIVFVYNGVGWSEYYEPLEAAGSSTTVAVNPIGAVVDRFPVGVVAAANVNLETTRAFNVLCQAHPTTTKLVQLHSFQLPRIGDVPVSEYDLFEGNDGYHLYTTGWMDMGFADIQGALFYIKVDMRQGGTPIPVQVSYRLNDDESQAFTLLGTAIADGTTTIQFDPTNKAGVQFRTVQFQVGLARIPCAALSAEINATALTIPLVDGSPLPTGGGVIQIESEYIRYASRSGNNLTVSSTANRGIFGSTAATHVITTDVDCLNLTPEMRGVTVVYRKRPDIRRTWVVRVDVNRMVETATLVDTDGDGTPETAATHQNVLDFFESLWNKKTLVKLIVPNQLPTGDNVRVEVADFTRQVDDNRLPSTIRGTMDVTLIEPVQTSP